MSHIVKAAAVQISPVLYSRHGTVEKVVKKIRELGKQGVQFATFPETIIPYYPYFSFVQPAFALGKEHQRLLEQSVTIPVCRDACDRPGREGRKHGRFDRRQRARRRLNLQYAASL